MLILIHPLAPREPAATQSLQAAVISNTNACPSGLCEPCWLNPYGSTTGVNQSSLVKCCRGPGEFTVADGDGAVDVDDEAEEELVAPGTVRSVVVSGIVDADVETIEENAVVPGRLVVEFEDGADNALRDFSARGR